MINIIIDNHKSKLIGDLPFNVRKKIEMKTSFKYPNYFFVPQRGNWDGWIKLFDKNSTFPTGLLYYIISTLDDFKIKYSLTDKRKIYNKKNIKIENKNGIILRDYQEKALIDVIDNKRGIVRLPTGAGKTILSAFIIKESGMYPNIFLVHRKSLLYQTIEVFKDFFGEDKVGQVGDNIVDFNPYVNVIMFQTLSNIFDIKYESLDSVEKDKTEIKNKIESSNKIQESKMIIIDECHHAGAKTVRDIMKKMDNALWRIGLSATPYRDDGCDLLIESYIGRIISSITASDLIKKGNLVNSRMRFIRYNPGGIKKRFKYDEIYKEEIVNNEYRNKIISEITLKQSQLGRSTLIVVKHIEHGRNLLKILNEMNIDAYFIEGKTKDKVRNEYLNKFKNKEVLVIISTIFSEGVDIPSLDVLINAEGGKSPTATFQKVGRALRPYKDKKECIYIDFIDPYKFLLDHSNQRIKILETEDLFNVGIVNYEKK